METKDVWPESLAQEDEEGDMPPPEDEDDMPPAELVEGEEQEGTGDLGHINRLDANKDGKLSLAEVMVNHPNSILLPPSFKEVDADGDGLLNVDEFAKLMHIVSAHNRKVEKEDREAALMEEKEGNEEEQEEEPQEEKEGNEEEQEEEQQE